jgi:hypothetical protein
MHALGSRKSMLTIRRAVAAATVALTALGAIAVATSPAAAGTVAVDAETVVRDIIFPVAGPNTFADTFGACRSGCTRGHEGTDIMAAKLVPLVAARDATVTWLKDTATPDGSEGNYVMLRDADGWEYWYIHVNNDSPGTDDGANPAEWIFAPGIERGAEVQAGQLVAYTGDSGNAEGTAPHLHFEIHNPAGEVVNPYLSLRAAARLASPLVLGTSPVTVARQAFVRALSEDFLGRAPNDIELATKVAELASGVDPATIVRAYAGSEEWIRSLVERYYRSTLGRAGDPGGTAHWTAAIRDGRSPASVAADFYGSDEYHRLAGGTDAAWITDLYDELLLRVPEPGGVEYWVGQVAAKGRHTVALAFYQSLESRLTRVDGLYDQLLGRLADAGGRAHWAGVLQDGQDVRLASFLASSGEYFGRAGARFG